jgi:hypothetical protein
MYYINCGSSTMARVALSCSLRNSVEVPKRAAWYAHNRFCPPWDPH